MSGFMSSPLGKHIGQSSNLKDAGFCFSLNGKRLILDTHKFKFWAAFAVSQLLPQSLLAI